MGKLVGTELSMNIAQIETEIEQFGDLIFNNYNLKVALSINLQLWMIAGFLDLTLITISENCTDSIELNLNLAINQINYAKSTIECLNYEGDLTEEEVTQMYEQLDYFIVNLNNFFMLTSF